MLQETHSFELGQRVSTSVSLNKARITNTDIQESEMQHRQNNAAKKVPQYTLAEVK